MFETGKCRRNKKMLGLMRGGGEGDKERLLSAFLTHSSVFPQKTAADIAGKQDLGCVDLMQLICTFRLYVKG